MEIKLELSHWDLEAIRYFIEKPHHFRAQKKVRNMLKYQFRNAEWDLLIDAAKKESNITS